jgi:uncharacterized membrane protein
VRKRVFDSLTQLGYTIASQRTFQYYSGKESDVLNPESSKTLLIVCCILLVLGMIILTPSARFLCLVLAVLCAAVPALFSVKRQRLIAVILLILSVSTAIWTYPEFKKHMNQYRESVRSRSK